MRAKRIFLLKGFQLIGMKTVPWPDMNETSKWLITPMPVSASGMANQGEPNT
jgi:hypothetical protein